MCRKLFTQISQQTREEATNLSYGKQSSEKVPKKFDGKKSVSTTIISIICKIGIGEPHGTSDLAYQLAICIRSTISIINLPWTMNLIRGSIIIKKRFDCLKTKSFFQIQKFFFVEKMGCCCFFFFFGTSKGVPYRGERKKIYKKMRRNMYNWAFTPAGAVVMVRASWTTLHLVGSL